MNPTPTQPSATPRTQAQLLPVSSHTLPDDVVYASFARALETELAAARAECELLRKTNLAQSADLATCAEALTKLTNWIEESRFQPRVGDTLQQVERIISSAVKAIKGEIP